MASSIAKSSSATGFELFGVKLSDSVNQDAKGQNVFLSPASIALAMSMCTVGARQETLQQMLHALEASSTDELTNTAEQVMQVLAKADNDKQVILKLANRLYAQKAYKLQDEYLQLVQSSFRADIKLEDFVNNGAGAVRTINAWVEEQTNKLIRDLLSPNDITRDTRLILVNCIYFKGTWQKQFKEYNTNQNADFHQNNGTISKVKLMYQKEKHAYAENKSLRVQIAHLPYKSDNQDIRFVFTVILPNEGVSLEEVEQKLTSNPKLMQEVLSHQGTTSQELLLYLPKFKMETQFQLNDVLIRLGMEHAFDDRADFSGIVSKDQDPAGLKISKVIHKAFIDVNEEGSEAAAATAVIMERSEAAAATAAVKKRCCIARTPKQQPTEFKADRPFLFFIRESRQDITLFHGKFLEPSSG